MCRDATGRCKIFCWARIVDPALEEAAWLGRVPGVAFICPESCQLLERWLSPRSSLAP